MTTRRALPVNFGSGDRRTKRRRRSNVSQAHSIAECRRQIALNRQPPDEFSGHEWRIESDAGCHGAAGQQWFVSTARAIVHGCAANMRRLCGYSRADSPRQDGEQRSGGKKQPEPTEHNEITCPLSSPQASLVAFWLTALSSFMQIRRIIDLMRWSSLR